jgi:hypothetical protein
MPPVLWCACGFSPTISTLDGNLRSREVPVRLEKWLFILIFVLRQKTTLLLPNCSLRRNFDCMAVGVTHKKCLAKVEHLHVIRDNARRYKLHSCCVEL